MDFYTLTQSLTHLDTFKTSMTFAEMLGATHLAGNEIVLVEAPMRPGCQEKRFIGQCEKVLGGKGDPENADQKWLSFFSPVILQLLSTHVCV